MNLTKLNYIDIKGEKLFPVVLYGANRPTTLIEWHYKVMVEYFRLAMNYIPCPFPSVSHGACANKIVEATIDTLKPDYYFLCDNDNIFLNKKCFNLMFDSVQRKLGIWSAATQSNHKRGPNGELNHPYASQASLCFSTELYNKLGRPDLDHWSESSDEYGGDTCEKLTYACEKNGYMVSLLYPSHSIDPNTDLGNGMRFGRGNTYGPNLMYHQMQNDNSLSENEFIEKCKEVIAGKYE